MIRRLGHDDADSGRLSGTSGDRRGLRRVGRARAACRCTARRRRSSTTATACSPGISGAVSRRRATTRWSWPRRAFPAELEVTARTQARTASIMGLRHRTLPDSRRAVSSRVGADGRGPADSPEFSRRTSGLAMFPARCIEKLMRREDLTGEEASAAMAEIMEGRAADAQIAGLLIGLAMKGERPAEIVGLARAMRAHAVPLSTSYEDVFDYCGTGGDRSGTFNISSCVAAGRGGMWRAGREARQSVGLEPVRGAPMSSRHWGFAHPRRRRLSSGVWPRRASGSSLRRHSTHRCVMRPAPAEPSAFARRSICSVR